MPFVRDAEITVPPIVARASIRAICRLGVGPGRLGGSCRPQRIVAQSAVALCALCRVEDRPRLGFVVDGLVSARAVMSLARIEQPEPSLSIATLCLSFEQQYGGTGVTVPWRNF